MASRHIGRHFIGKVISQCSIEEIFIKIARDVIGAKLYINIFTIKGEVIDILSKVNCIT